MQTRTHSSPLQWLSRREVSDQGECVTSGDVCLVGGGGVSAKGVSATPPVNRMTDRQV